jgi:hypothetical protein
VTIKNVRNFHYRTVDDFDERWETRTFDLGQLKTLDVSFTFWGPTDIAHTMLHFGFADGRHLAVSVETRKEVGEKYEPIGSFFKMFELIYIIADERDLVGLRTNYRKEHTYLFPLDWAPHEIRALLVDILERGDQLGRKPAYYATIKGNCTTSLLAHIDKVLDQHRPFSLDLLLNGFMPQYAYERGQIPNDRPYEDVMQTYSVDERALAGPVDETYSKRIREGLGPPVKRRHFPE